MKGKILFTIIFLSIFGVVKADEAVTFKATGPSQVILDKPFKISFTVNAKGKDFRLPELADFDVLAGPFESYSSSVSFINGEQTSSVTYTYTYTLLAKKTGRFAIPSASVTVKKDKYTSNGLSIEVLPADAPSASSGQDTQGRAQEQQNSGLSKENLFIRTIVSKTNVYEQEAVLLTYRLYSVPTNNIVNVSAKKIPEFKGFIKNDIQQDVQLRYENYNGRNYTVADLYQVILFPQRSGTVEVESALFDLVLRIENQNTRRSFFDSFFDSYTNVSREVTAPRVKINVKELPVTNKPIAFNGTVGDFRVTSSISANEVKANEAVTLKIVIEGSGNMRMIKTPSVKFPESFEQYDPKVNNDFKVTTSGVSGNKIVEYLVIPRHPGEFEIPAVNLIYFDLSSNTYKTLSTPTYKLNVLKGEGGTSTAMVDNNYVNKEDVKQLGNDIRYIRTGNVKIYKEKIPLVGSATSWLMYIIPLTLALLVFILLGKRAKENANVSLVKNKKANKIARKRLTYAQKLLQEGKKDKFYDEVLKAIWTYLSDKLSIPVASLTKENISAELTKSNVSSETIGDLNQVLNTCEFARYAPSSGQQEMGNIYEETVEVISKLEEQIKR